MPVHDQSYKRYTGTRKPPGAAWRIIAWTGIKWMLSVKWFLFVLLLAWVPFLVRAVTIYLAENFPQMAILAPSPTMFRNFVEQQGFFVVVVTVYVGAGIVANDRRANALQIYLAKPLTRVEYVVGKLAVLVVFLLFVTLLPAIVLMLLQVTFAGNIAFVREHAFLIPAITVFAFLQVLVSSFTILALSSLSTSPRYVGMLYAGVLIFMQAVFETLQGLTGRSDLSWLSFSASLNQLGDVIFRIEPRYETAWGVSLLVIAMLLALSLCVLERRIRAVEVVT